MKKILYALLLLFALKSAACAEKMPLFGATDPWKEKEEIVGVWDLELGMSRAEVWQILDGKNAVRINEYFYAPSYAEEEYRVDFYGCQGTLIVRFSQRGLHTVRFALDRTDLKGEIDPSVTNVSETGEKSDKCEMLSPMFLSIADALKDKYGAPTRSLKYANEVCGYEWRDTNAKHIIVYEDRFIPESPTVLTFEDAKKW